MCSAILYHSRWDILNYVLPCSVLTCRMIIGLRRSTCTLDIGTVYTGLGCGRHRTLVRYTHRQSRRELRLFLTYKYFSTFRALKSVQWTFSVHLCIRCKCTEISLETLEFLFQYRYIITVVDWPICYPNNAKVTMANPNVMRIGKVADFLKITNSCPISVSKMAQN